MVRGFTGEDGMGRLGVVVCDMVGLSVPISLASGDGGL